MLKEIKNWLRENRLDVWIMLGLFLLAAIPRLWGLGTFLTADEKNWMGRSYEFVRAIKDWRFNDTLQTTHPGVTTLWLSGISITGWMYLTHTPFSYQTLAHFAAAAQLPIALANSLAVPVIYMFLVKLFKEEPRFATPEEQAAASTSGVFLPLLTSFFIALNPLLIGYSRVAHVDALLASLMMLAALVTMIYAQNGYKRGWLIASAVLSGLAILTKAPAVFLIPFFVLVVLVDKFTPTLISPSREGEKKEGVGQWLRARSRDFTLWLLIIVLMFLVLWPAMLFVPNPKGNFLLVKRDLLVATETPHDMTEDYAVNSAFYPLTLLTKTSPLDLVFVAVAVIWLLAKSTVFKTQNPNKAQFSKHKTQTVWLIVAYVFFFVVMMTLGAKKGDRYILPVFPALDILAAAGILLIANYKRIVSWVLGGVATVFLIGTVIYYHPYAIAYSNPLFRDNLSQELGWGEGLDQVAAWLNEHDPRAIVASWYPEELGAYTTAQVAHINAHEQSKVRYVVLYRNMFGRAPDHYANNFIDEYYKKREPIFVAHVAGKEFAWVYDKWTFERVLGEMLPGMEAKQEIRATHDGLIGADLAIATYSGRAKSGSLVIRLVKKSGEALFEWQVPISQVEDGRWLTVRLPSPQHLSGQDVLISLQTTGTSAGNAPTIRYTSDRDYRKSPLQVNGQARNGDLAIRLRYAVNGQEATEEDTRLFK